MKVLITAFKPFYKSSNNYSMEVLNYIENVEKLVIDVVYDECYNELIQNYDLTQFDLIIALGEARSRNVLTLETTARNIASCSIPDNQGIFKKDEKIIVNGLPKLKTLVDIEKCSNVIEFSNDAGKFVCNNLYYHLLYCYPNRSLFIHIPECNNEIDKYKLYAKTIEEVINKLK